MEEGGEFQEEWKVENTLALGTAVSSPLSSTGQMESCAFLT